MIRGYVLIVALFFQGCQSLNDRGGQDDHLPSTLPAHYKLTSQSDSIVPLQELFSLDTQGYAFILPSLKAFRGGEGVEAKDCKKCHTQYFDEWQQTTHAHALSDMQFQAELSKKSSPRWLCLNCHIPNQDQREYDVIGLDSGNVLKPVVKKNRRFKKSFQDEAISCATCHLRQDEDGETIVIGAIGSQLAPHPVRKDPSALRNICLRCHDPKGQGITDNLLCWFQTQDELLANPNMKGRDCVSCHMPTEVGSLVSGYPQRIRHQHHWVGGGIPKTMDGFDSVLERGYSSGLRVLPQFNLGHLSLILDNQAGHSLPSGDPERYYRVDIIQYLDELIVSDTLLRIGQVWQWDPAQKISDNRLKGAEVRDLIVPFASELANSKHHQKVEVLISHHRLSVENLQQMKTAQVDDKLVRGIQSRMKNMEKLYPRFRFTHKFILTRENSSSQWILEKWTDAQLNDYSKEEHLK